MSRERARRRAEREREQAIRAAARARQAERAERSAARRRTLLGWLPATSTGRPTRRPTPGLLAQRRRRELTTTVCLLLALNVLVWIVSREWEARALFVMVSLLAAPVLHTLLFRRR